MIQALSAIVTSKRAIVVSFTVGICALCVLTGKMSVPDFLTVFERLGALLATLYGVENIAAAVAPVVTVHNNPPAPSMPPPSVTVRLDGGPLDGDAP